MAANRNICEIAICEAPKLSDLVAVRMKIGDPLLEEYGSYHTAITAIVRELATNNKEILACNGWLDDDFFMIMNEERWKESGWRECLKGSNLEIMEDRRQMTVELFANSVWYTIMCRMGPEWNLMGKMLVQGCDFLTNAGSRKFRAIEMKVAYLPPGRLELALIPRLVTMNQLTLNDFGRNIAAKEFIQGRSNSVRFSGDSYSSCFVLPRQTRGTIMTLTKSIPKSCVFEDYEELQGYWKSLYGYCLPQQEPEFYCEVKFFGPSRVAYTYPSHCLLAKPAEITKATETDWNQCVKAFVTDFYAKVPVLCDVPLKLILQPQSMNMEFQTASTKKEKC